MGRRKNLETRLKEACELAEAKVIFEECIEHLQYVKEDPSSLGQNYYPKSLRILNILTGTKNKVSEEGLERKKQYEIFKGKKENGESYEDIKNNAKEYGLDLKYLPGFSRGYGRLNKKKGQPRDPLNQ